MPSLAAPFSAELVELRPHMIRYARMRITNRDTAEDLVQEALEAALHQAHAFAGLSSYKTWVFAILRNRIIDHHRRSRHAVVPLSALVGDGEDWLDRWEQMVGELGLWGADAGASAPPDDLLQTRQLLARLRTCMDHLPDSASRAFMMRDFLGFESEEICARLGITANNLHVTLHRVRGKLRRCLCADTSPTRH
jgi:RNA polymerase sigma-70 factor (ECF subfamily)